MEFGDSLRAAEGWKGIVATLSVVPRRPPRLRDGDAIRCAGSVRARVDVMRVRADVRALYGPIQMPCGLRRGLRTPVRVPYDTTVLRSSTGTRMSPERLCTCLIRD